MARISLTFANQRLLIVKLRVEFRILPPMLGLIHLSLRRRDMMSDLWL